MLPSLAMPPGYHALNRPHRPVCWEWIHWLALRWISTALSLTTVVLAGLILVRATRRVAPAWNGSNTVLPPAVAVLFPALHRPGVDRPGVIRRAAGNHRSLLQLALFATVSLAVRQTSIVWTGLYWLLAVHRGGHAGRLQRLLTDRQPGWTRESAENPESDCCRYLAVLLPGVAFIAFVLWNGGNCGRQPRSSPIDQHLPHPDFHVAAGGLDPDPALADRQTARHRAADQDQALDTAAFAFHAGHLLVVLRSHPPPQFRRTRIPSSQSTAAMDGQSSIVRLAAFIPMAWAGLTLIVIKLRSPVHYWLFPLAVIAYCQSS